MGSSSPTSKDNSPRFRSVTLCLRMASPFRWVPAPKGWESWGDGSDPDVGRTIAAWIACFMRPCGPVWLVTEIDNEVITDGHATVFIIAVDNEHNAAVIFH